MSKIKYNSPKDHPDYKNFIKEFRCTGYFNDFKCALGRNDKNQFAKSLLKCLNSLNNEDFLVIMKSLKKFKSFLSVCGVGFDSCKKYENVIITKPEAIIENKNVVIIANSKYHYVKNAKYILVQHSSLVVISNIINSEIYVKDNSDVNISGEKAEIFVKDTSKVLALGNNIVKAYDKSVITARDKTKCFMNDCSELYAKDEVECILLHESRGMFRGECNVTSEDFSKVNVDGKCKVKGTDESGISLFNCETLHVNKNVTVRVRPCLNNKNCKNEIIAKGRSIIDILRKDKDFGKTIIAKENATVISEFESDKIKTEDNASIKLVK